MQNTNVQDVTKTTMIFKKNKNKRKSKYFCGIPVQQSSRCLKSKDLIIQLNITHCILLG
jgi:hypothetical protein